MNKWYFTFPQRLPTKDNYVCIEADDYSAAREKMVAVHGQAWAFQYTEEQFLPQIEEFGLTEIPL